MGQAAAAPLMKPVMAALLSLFFVVAIGGAAYGEPAFRAEEVLTSAFANRYEFDSTQIIDVLVRSGEETPGKKRLAVATKRIEGRLHSLGRFIEPEYLRGTTILSIENSDRNSDHFVYIRGLQKIRRITAAQRQDSLMGTDLVYEDIERRRVSDYRLEEGGMATVGGESAFVVLAVPRLKSAYERVEFLVATSDSSLLETRYFKRAADTPYKVAVAPRKSTTNVGGHAIPTYVKIENSVQGTTTEVWIHELRVNPELDDSLFSSSAIEVGRPIPGLE